MKQQQVSGYRSEGCPCAKYVDAGASARYIPSSFSHADAQEQNNLLNYPSQSIRSGFDAARNYLQLHLLVALCLLVVSILATCCCLDNKRRRRIFLA